MDLTSPPTRIYHPIPPGLLDADVVKVLRRLRRYQHEAYLVGGCVRDLLLGVTPKDFDVATGAHPRDIRRIFRNSKVVGRRFRLAHIFFRDGKVIEVATFRRAPWSEKVNGAGLRCPQPSDEDGGLEEAAANGGEPGCVQPCDDDEGPAELAENGGDGCTASQDCVCSDDDLLITDDNQFGTPEEDARRRDFTINGLFYDLHTREIVDHVQGLPDIEARVVRAIGDPEIRIQEDPVRILRAIRFASRLGLTIDPPLWEAMVRYRREILRSAGPRVLEEIFRLLRCNRVLAAVSLLQSSGQLEILLPEVFEHLEATGEANPPPLQHARRPESSPGGAAVDGLDPAGSEPRPGRARKPGTRGGDGARAATLPPSSSRFWRLLALLDQQIGERGMPEDHLLLAVLLYLPLQRRLAQPEEAGNLGRVVDGLVTSLASRLKLPRREAERLRQLFVTERRLAQRRHRAGRKEALLRRPCLDEALYLHELGRRLDGEPLDRVHHLRELLGRSAARSSPRSRVPAEEADGVDPLQPDGTPAEPTASDPAIRRRRPHLRRRTPQPRV